MEIDGVLFNVQGTTGSQGKTGFTGIQGIASSIQGISGIQNIQGATGSIGLTGIMGNIGVNCLMPPFSGKSYTQMTLNGTLITASPTGNLIRLTLFVPSRTITISSVSINITTGTASNYRVLIYNDLNGFPNNKLLETTDLDCSTIGIKTFTTSFTFLAGQIYWIGGYASNSFTCQLIPSANLILISVNTGGITYTTFQYNYTYGTAPSSLNGISVSSFSNGSAIATYLTI